MHIIGFMKGDERYWCDHCSTKKSIIVNGKRKLQRNFFACYDEDHFIKHLESKKHDKNMCIGDNVCKLCGESFDDEGWEAHKKRNQEMWRFRKLLNEPQLTCNNFVMNNKRFTSFAALRKHIEGDDAPKNKTKNMDIVYPKMVEITKKETEIDGCVIQKNEEQNENYEVPAVDEIFFDEFCDMCYLPINYLNYKKSILQDRGVIVCDCVSDSEFESDSE